MAKQPYYGTEASQQSERRSEANHIPGRGRNFNADDWKSKAREIADRIGLKRWRNGQRQISARNIAAAVTGELAKDPTTHAKKGQRGEGNVRNLALRGWKFIPPKNREDAAN